VGTVYVGNEPKCHGSLAIMFQCFIGHDWPEIRTTDTDVDDVANALASVALPRAAPHAVREIAHLVEDGMDLRHNVLAINADGWLCRFAKSHVQNGAIFGDVDLLASKHGVNSLAQSRLICQLHE